MEEYNVPFVANIPVEIEQQLNQQANQEITYLDLKNKKTLKKFMDVSSNLRKVADYLSDYFKTNFMESVSYKKIAEILGLTENVVKNCVCELAGWENYPLVIVKTPKKAGQFQLHSRNINDTESWITYQSRHIASRQQRLDKTTNAVFVKKRQIKKTMVTNSKRIKKFINSA
jgi:hypothetical protein